jgi:hypothetical protein
MLRLMACFFLVGVAAAGHAQERKAWRYVDAAGRITYSQTPPVHSGGATRIDISPAAAGRGGHVSGHVSGYGGAPWDDPRHYSRVSRNLAAPAYSPGAANAQEQHRTALYAERRRQRNTDCNNPATLQYLDSLSIPRRSPPIRHPRG